MYVHSLGNQIKINAMKKILTFVRGISPAQLSRASLLRARLRAREASMPLAASEKGLGDDRKALRGRTVSVEVDIAAK